MIGRSAGTDIPRRGQHRSRDADPGGRTDVPELRPPSIIPLSPRTFSKRPLLAPTSAVAPGEQASRRDSPERLSRLAVVGQALVKSLDGRLVLALNLVCRHVRQQCEVPLGSAPHAHSRHV